MNYERLGKLMLKCYNHITDYYFYVSYITVIILLLVSYQTETIVNHIFCIKMDNFHTSQIVFYLVGNFVMCIISHLIIIKWFKRSPISVIWILPLVFQMYRIIIALF